MSTVASSTTKLRELVENYVAGLTERRQTLATYYSEIAAAVSEQKDLRYLEALASFQYDVHKLAGSAGSMGLSELGKAAGALDVYMSAVQARGDSFNDVDLNQLSTLYDVLDRMLIDQHVENSTIIDRLETSPDGFLNSTPMQVGARLLLSVGQWVSVIPKLADKLRPFGWTLETVTADALERRLQGGDPVGLILADHVEAAAIARLVGQRVPVVSVGDQGSLDERIEVMRSGVRALLDTPVDVFDIVDLIDRMDAPPDEKSIKVVLVDDDPALVALMDYQFQVAGIDATCLDSAENLLSVLSDVQPDVLVLDRNMPRWDGFAIAMVVRQISAFADVPLVFLTADRRPDSRLMALALGGDDYLHKPVDGDHLVSLVRTRSLRARALRRKIMTDGLTGLLNHIAFVNEAAYQFSLANRLKRPMAVAILDLDHFKAINDTQGHQVGDTVLRGISRVLRQRLRRYDIIGRLGGEEFAVVMPGTDMEKAAQVLDELRNDFSLIDYAGAEGVFRATFSCGISGFNPALSAADGAMVLASVEDLIRQADSALYEAKNQGRNRISIAEM